MFFYFDLFAKNEYASIERDMCSNHHVAGYFDYKRIIKNTYKENQNHHVIVVVVVVEAWRLKLTRRSSQDSAWLFCLKGIVGIPPPHAILLRVHGRRLIEL